MAELSIATDTVFRVIEILHELAGQDQGLERDDIGEGGDDASAEDLTAQTDDARLDKVVMLLHDLNVDEQSDLVALLLLGRGEFDLDDWQGARTEAQEQLAGESLPVLVSLIAGDAAVAEFLEAGLNAFGYSSADRDAETIVAHPDATGEDGPGDVADDAKRQIPSQVVT